MTRDEQVTIDNDDVKIIIVDDEPAAVRSLEIPLISNGFSNIVTLNSGEELENIISGSGLYLVLLDLYMPDMVGDRLLQMVKEKQAGAEVIIVTGDGSLNTAVELMRVGASDYLVKPIEEGKLLSSVKRSVEILKLRRSNETLKKGLLSRKLENPQAFRKIITQSETMLDVFRYLEIVAPTSQPVLITGETGVGKELIAEVIHSLSRRRGSYIKVNVAGLDDNMFSDTLFGHFKGAFTGAVNRRAGLLEKAEQGTVLLDEIGSLSSQSQVKLLRLIQEQEYYPIGADAPRLADIRIIASTNHSIEELQNSKGFRNDLYYRLRTHHIHISPLRERLDDIPLLLEKFILEASAELNKKPPTPHPALFDLLASYHYPGNLRELRAMVFEAVARHSSHQLSTEIFKKFIPLSEGRTPDSQKRKLWQNHFNKLNYLPSIQQLNEMLVEEALQRCQNNQSLAARMLGITPSALNKRLNKNDKC